MEPTQVEAIEQAATLFNIWPQVSDTIKWARLYGGAIAVMLIDGQDPKTPLRLDTIGRDQFKGLLVLDRWMVEPSLNDLVTEVGPDLGNPKYYDVTADAPALPRMRVHYSRCLRLEGIRLPYYQRMMENLWGISIIERLYDRMIAYDSASTGAAQLVYRAYLRVYRIDGMREIIGAGGPGEANLLRFVDFMRRTQSIEGITLIDGKDDLAAMAQPSFAGLSDAMISFGQQVAGALQIPLTRLFGQSPTGMNATGESDLRTYYDGIKQQQHRWLAVPLTRVYKAIAKSLGVKLPSGFALDFRSLWVLSDQDKAGIASTDSATIVSEFNSGIISQEEALKEKRQLAKITGRGTNITDESIKAASKIPGAQMAEEQHGLAMEQAAAALEEGGEEEAEPADKAKKKKTKDALDEYIPQGTGLTAKRDLQFPHPRTGRVNKIKPGSRHWVGNSSTSQQNNGVVEVVKHGHPMGSGVHIAHSQVHEHFDIDDSVQDGITADCDEEAKLTQEEVKYGPGKGEERCENCSHFANDACQIVRDAKPQGWCELFKVRLRVTA
jgi:hypothetical protein